MAQLLQVLNTFLAEVDGEMVTFAKGDLIDSSLAATKSWPHMFGPVVVRFPAAEKPDKKDAKPPQATAAQEAGIAASVKAEAEAEKAPTGHAMRVRPVEAATAAPGEKRGK